MISIYDVKFFWADAPKDGYKIIYDIDVPFKTEGCVHLEFKLKLVFLRLGTIKLGLCFH